MKRSMLAFAVLLLFSGVFRGASAIDDPGLAVASDEPKSLGPPIGVLLGRGGSVMVAAPQSRLRVEAEEFSRKLGAGDHKLWFDGETAYLGEFPFKQAFRFRDPESQSTKVGERVYQGWIEVLPPLSGKESWKVVNRVPMELYLIGVVGSEMYTDFSEAALQAQAIASRTYALYKIVSAAAGTRYHLSDSTYSQVYSGDDGADKIRAAVLNTCGQVLLFEGRIFKAHFHSTCGGATASSARVFGSPVFQPLSGVRCGSCQASPRFEWDYTFEAAAVERALRPMCKRNRIALGEIQSIEPVERGSGGHASYVRIEHSRGSFEISGEHLRAALGYGRLSSTSFTCSRQGDSLVFRGQGYGHGVGMCQWGAAALAKKGYDAVAILRFYYQGSSVGVLWQ